MPRFVLRTAMLCLLLCAGTVCALLTAGPGRSSLPPAPPALSTDTTTTESTTTESTTTGPVTTDTVTTVPVTTVVTTVTTAPVTTAPVTTAPVQTTTTNTSSTVLAFNGHGWGHGLGLSQWGAYGYALHGWSYKRILAHYYSGTTLGAAPVSKVRVLVATGKKVMLEGAAAWSIVDAAGAKMPMTPATPLQLRPGLTVADAQLTGPLTLASSVPLTVNGRTFRGVLTVLSNGKSLQVVDTVALESYVKGVVASEMPQAWPEAALEAQAIAARSYALANRQQGGVFDLYSDGRSQVYGGVAAETPRTTAAVAATRGKVVLWHGQLANTLYSSTSGGRTASALAELGQAIPYLVSVADPYDTLSPYHDWGPVLVGGNSAAKELKLAGSVEDVQVSDGADGRVASLTAVDPLASQVTVSGSQARAALGLPSTWFVPSVLSLEPRSVTMGFGAATSLTGFLHADPSLPAIGVSFEAKSAGTGWVSMDGLTLDSTGAFSVNVSPQVSTQYRLAWGNVRAGLAKIAVAPIVTAVETDGAVAGSVRPASVGSIVELQQQQADSTWTTLSSTTTSTLGRWVFGGTLASGTYRIRCAPGHGLAPGLSPSFEVP